MESKPKEVKMKTLLQVYKLYTPKEMNGRTFVKLFKDCKLLDKKLSSTSLDIIFSKVKTKGKLKIKFEQFEKALVFAAKEKGVALEALKKKICSSKGPMFKGTKTDKVKWHDDKKSYTGVYKRGGPTNVDKGKGKIADLSDLTNRKKANVRGINKDIIKHS